MITTETITTETARKLTTAETRRYYVTAVIVVDAETAQDAVDQVARAVQLDRAGEPIVEIHVEAPSGLSVVPLDEWELAEEPPCGCGRGPATHEIPDDGDGNGTMLRCHPCLLELVEAFDREEGEERARRAEAAPAVAGAN